MLMNFALCFRLCHHNQEDICKKSNKIGNKNCKIGENLGKIGKIYKKLKDDSSILDSCTRLFSSNLPHAL